MAALGSQGAGALFGSGSSGAFKRGLDQEELAEHEPSRSSAGSAAGTRRLKLQRSEAGLGGAVALPGGRASVGGGDRSGIIAKVFCALDEVNGSSAAKGRLSSGQLRRYATLLGFDGDSDEWAIQFSELCVEFKWDARAGIDLAQFTNFVNSAKAFVTDQDLLELIPSVASGVAASTSRSGAPRRSWLSGQRSNADSKDPAADGGAATVSGDGTSLTAEDVRTVLGRALGPQAKIDEIAARLVARMAERVMDEVVGAAARLARHRGSNVLEASDLRLILGHDCGLWSARS